MTMEEDSLEEDIDRQDNGMENNADTTEPFTPEISSDPSLDEAEHNLHLFSFKAANSILQNVKSKQQMLI
ncbi:unnamed protein product [Phytophthora fragariaefolia]|uniref:Unnamed protein product n=1 Tax=Phytophthora fragariaefolia TaxID=1490495 RepID=A0A9W6U9T6_9STRA|nr:unnamed protein product [Phytophthora fragariaefolia]